MMRTTCNFTNRAAELVLAILCAAGLVYLFGLTGNAQSADVMGRSAVLWMVRRWSGSGGDLSHGWLIPLVSAYVIWHRRAALRRARRRPAPLGILLVAGCLLLHWVGYRAQLTRLSLLALVGLTWSIPYLLYGFDFARHLIFPSSYLIFCIPLSFLNSITVPLRAFVSAASTVLLNGLGIAAVRSGTAIRSLAAGGFNFDVADPCSGLRSLLALTALTAAFAVLTQPTLPRKWLLFLAAIPSAILGNIARIVTIAILAETIGQEFALGFYHDYSGYIVFTIAVLALVGFASLLKKDWKGTLRACKPAV